MQNSRITSASFSALVFVLGGLAGFGLSKQFAPNGIASNGAPPSPIGNAQGIGERHVAQVVDFIQEEFDLGSFTWGSSAPFDLVISNNSDSVFALRSINVSCDCATIDRSSYLGQELIPGEHFIVHGTLQCGVYSGAFVRHVLAEAVDADGESVQLLETSLKFRVDGTWRIDPPTIDFGTCVISEKSEQQVSKIIEFVSSTDSLLSVHSDAAWLDAHVVDDSRPEVTRIHVRANPSEILPGLQPRI